MSNGDDLPEVYYIETIEQMRGIADELRLRVGEALTRQPMTVTQLGALLNEAPAKIHYHVRELERLGLVKLVETREKGGILEKYYRTVAKNISVSPTILQHATPDEAMRAATEYLRMIEQGFLRGLGEAIRKQTFEGPEGPVLGMGVTQAWMTAEEVEQFDRQVHALLEPYVKARGVLGEREITIAKIMFQSHASPEAAGEQQAGVPEGTESAEIAHATDVAGSTQATGERPRVRHQITAGATTIDRADLEAAVARGEQLDISVYGFCIVANDVTPELIERAIARFHSVGGLKAPAAVREALKRKEPPAKK